MSNDVSRKNSNGQTAKTVGLTAAGRHMNQPRRTTISASRGTSYSSGVNLVDEWMAESSGDVLVPADGSTVPEEFPLENDNNLAKDSDAVVKKMQMIDDRERDHRRKKRVALILSAAVTTAIPVLALILLFLL